jgi:hypothetical protein
MSCAALLGNRPLTMTAKNCLSQAGMGEPTLRPKLYGFLHQCDVSFVGEAIIWPLLKKSSE